MNKLLTVSVAKGYTLSDVYEDSEQLNKFRVTVVDSCVYEHERNECQHISSDIYVE